MGDFLPKVENTAGQGTGPKAKEKMNVTHYYTQTNNKLNENQQWTIKGTTGGGAQGQRFMPYSSNTSSVEAISNRLKAQSTQIQAAQSLAQTADSYESNMIFNNTNLGGAVASISQTSVRSGVMN